MAPTTQINPYPLDVTPFEKAIQRLQEGLQRYAQDIFDTQIRDGLIQRFEFTYELSHKTLKRYLESIAATPEEYDTLPFQEIIRSGCEQKLLKGEWLDWKQYRHMRSQTSHTYEEEIALEVVQGIPKFLAEAIHLRDQLRLRLKK
jgi:nucleotidyltransferase substrate binding protein (TIGR01987 family)